MWFVITCMCVYYTVPFVTSLVWRFKVVWLRITDEHTVVVNSPTTCITPRRNTITREQLPSPWDPHRQFSQPINLSRPWSFNLLKIVNWLVCVYFIHRANCLYKNSTHITVFIGLWTRIFYCESVMITQDICPIRAEISTQTFGKMFYLLFVG